MRDTAPLNGQNFSQPRFGVPTGKIGTFRFSTRSNASKDQFDAWHCAMERSIDVSPGEEFKAGFPADLSAWNLGGAGIVSMDMPGSGYQRCWANVSRPASNDWSFMIPVSDGCSARYSSRRVVISSIDRPFQGSSSDTHVVSIFVPRDLFPDVTLTLDSGRSEIRDVATGALFVDFVLALQTRLKEGLAADPIVVRGMLQSMMMLALSPSAARFERALGVVDTLTIQRISKYVDENLRSATLNAREICSVFHLSRSKLYRLFEPNGGVQSFIGGKRMEAINRSILSGSPRAIRSIAADYGYEDHSSFARSFRAHIGMSTGEVRDQAARLHQTSRPLGPLDTFFRDRN